MTQLRAVTGDTLVPVDRLLLTEGASSIVSDRDDAWALRGCTSHGRYTTAAEASTLGAVQEILGRAQATCAALIPIRKSQEWS